MNNPLVNYRLAKPGLDQQPARGLYEYVMARGGVYLRAQNAHLKVCFPIGRCEVRGLAPIAEIFDWHLPRVPVAYLERILTEARQAALADLEKLFHLHHDGEWFLDVPEQDQQGASCRSLDDESRNRAQIELHSHHSMPAFFSGTDDRDEQGFRVYAVVGRVLESPEIRVRVGVYGYFQDIPAESVFELPEGVSDVNT